MSAWRYDQETGDIIMDGWEKGIAPSPHFGCGAIQCANISTETGEVMCSYVRSKQVSNDSTATSVTLTAVQNNATLTYDFAGQGKKALYAGTWIHVTSGVTGMTTGYYYIISADTSSPQNLTFSTGYSISSNVTPTANGTVTFSTVDMGKPIHSAVQIRNPDVYNYYILDSNGYLWENIHNGTIPWVMLSNPSSDAITSPNGLAIYQPSSTTFSTSGYIFLFGANHIYYASFVNDAASSWAGISSAWQNTNYTSSNTWFHTAITPKNKDGVYYCDGNFIGSFAQVPGKTLDPTDSTTYTFTKQSVILPWDETATSLAELSPNLLIGGVHNVLYQYDYGAVTANEVSGTTMIFTPEYYTQHLLTVNNLVYIFQGSKGNIYITNGSSVSPILTVPDYVASSPTGSVVEPFFIWGAVMFLRGRIYFSVQATNCGGIWSFVPVQGAFIQQNVGQALRLEVQSSYGTYNGMATLLLPPSGTTGQNVNGPQYWSGWFDGTSTYGIDTSGTTPYVGTDTSTTAALTTIVESDLVPIGSYIQKGNFTSLQTRYAAALVSGESVQVQYRLSLGATWNNFGDSTTGTDNTAGSTGLRFPIPFANALQVQFRAILTGITSNSSFVRLKEFRLTK